VPATALVVEVEAVVALVVALAQQALTTSAPVKINNHLVATSSSK